MMDCESTLEPSLSKEAYTLGEKYKLGVPTAMYGTGFKLYVVCMALFVACIIGLVIFAGGLRSGQSIAAIAVVLIAFTGVFLVALVQRRWRVYIYADGIVVKKGLTVEALRWEDIKLVERVKYRSSPTSGAITRDM